MEIPDTSNPNQPEKHENQALSSPYEQLKEHVSRCITDTDLIKLKQHFSPQIDSWRSLSKICSVSDLFVVLENRDCLSEDNIACLCDIALVIDNKEVKKLTHTYEKLFGSEPKPCICEMPKHLISRSQSSISTFGYIKDATPFSLGRCFSRDETDFDTIIIHLSKSIGEVWPVLLRALNMTENFIRGIRRQYKDANEQAMHALQTWKREGGANASLSALRNALDNRNCKRKGLGPHLINQNWILCH